MNARRWIPALCVLAALAGPPAAPAAEVIDADCMVCHGEDPTLSMKKGGRTVSLYVEPGMLKSSAHAKLACVKCHTGFDPFETPHKANIAPIRCESCHPGAPAKHVFHAALVGAREKNGVPGMSCKSCHGTHDVAKVATPSDRLGSAELEKSCGRCHQEAVSHFEKSAHGRAAAAGQEGAPRCQTCHDKPITRGQHGDSLSAATKLDQEKLCLSCHLDDPAVRSRMTPGAGFIAAYDQSVHGKALRGGNAAAPTCADCHGSHEMAKGFEPGSKANKQHISATCGACHDKVAHAYDQSVHGAAVAKGSFDSPSCTDCHGEHTIKKADDPDSPVAAKNVSAQVCSPCHSSVRLSAKYGIRNDRFKTFEDSFHGLAIRGGSVSAANCASCHGSHDILPSSDPRSMVHPARLAATCGQCHPGASTAFAQGKVHLDMTAKEEQPLFWVGLIYTLLIVGTIGGMFVHNVFDFWRKSVHHLKVRREGRIEPEPAGNRLYVRMTVSERVQHTLLVVSFVVLVFTGFALRWPEMWLFEGIRRFSSTLFDLRGIVHRVAGVVLVLASVYHLWYMAMTPRGRGFLRDIMLRGGDLKDVVGALRWYTGLSKERPRFGRFSYIEKSEYWALVWGTVVMGVTGVILWFQDYFIETLSKLGWDIARTVHFYEAVLATLAIIVWHLYFVIFNPDVYPMNLAWFKGTISEAEMQEEHPLELEEILRKEQEEQERQEDEEERKHKRQQEEEGGTT